MVSWFWCANNKKTQGLSQNIEPPDSHLWQDPQHAQNLQHLLQYLLEKLRNWLKSLLRLRKLALRFFGVGVSKVVHPIKALISIIEQRSESRPCPSQKLRLQDSI